jgi:hypothetical protein
MPFTQNTHPGLNLVYLTVSDVPLKRADLNWGYKAGS